MVKRKPYHTLASHALRSAPIRAVLGCVAALLPALLISPQPEGQPQGKHASLLTFASGNARAVPSCSFSDYTNALKPLSDLDEKLYRTAFNYQKNGKWDEAARYAELTDSPLLMGHIKAQRYLSRSYKSKDIELAQWVLAYSDHPQANDIYALTTSRDSSLKAYLPMPERRPTLPTAGSEEKAAYLEDTSFGNNWSEGLSAWESGDIRRAARLFSAIADQPDELSPQAAARASYWAWRTFDRLGDKKTANAYLQQAAESPRNFYGILARARLQKELELDERPQDLSEADIKNLMSDAHNRRAAALAQIGQAELAEKEMRSLFLQADMDGKHRLLALAHELNLASVQLSMAQRLKNSDHALDFARYPIPLWRPAGGFKVDPALIFALMRQESGFTPNAVSPGGALGLMQLMPQTASFMQRRTPTLSGKITEPVTNITLGQSYVRHLLDNNLVDGNLIYLLSAYNAGPGRLQEWKQSGAHVKDPLLFMETIPLTRTRHYVMQVMANYWIYSELEGRENSSLYDLAADRWPEYNEADAKAAYESHAG